MLTKACLIVGKIKRNLSFHPYIIDSFTSHSASCDLWKRMAWFLLLSDRVPGAVTTVEPPSVYAIPRNPWNYGILSACFSLGIRLHLEVTGRPTATWVSFWHHSDHILSPLKSFQWLPITDGSKNEHWWSQGITGYFIHCFSLSSWLTLC